MDPNILREIFCRVPSVDLFTSVSSVCQSWEATCWDLMFWSHQVVDMSATGAGFGMVKMSNVEEWCLPQPKPNRAPGFFGKLDSHEKHNMDVTLRRKLRSILGDEISSRTSLQSWRVSLTTVILPSDLEISDSHLLYVAERTPCVRHLLLLCPSKITVTGFIKALECWKHLGRIHLGPIEDDSFAEFIKGIGANCKKIESLHIHKDRFRLDQRSAVLIGKSLPGLKKLELELGIIQPSGITTLYNFCPQLEEVYFNNCQRERDKPYGEERELDRFRLTWTVDEIGLVNWEVTPCSFDVEHYDGYYKNDTRFIEYISSLKYLDDMKATLQPSVGFWLLNAIIAPRHNGVQPHDGPR
ncbi:F-box/LRR-repeat protein At3g48880-like isoform X2 [Silene latifolia]